MTERIYRPKSREEIKKNMSAIRSKDNRTESLLRKALFKEGFRYRKYHRGLPGRPDIVFPAQRIAVFVDGDFWHARMLREEAAGYKGTKMPVPNNAYWSGKFSKRVEKDLAVNKKLQELGWCVLRFWESDLKKDLTSAVAIIRYNVGARRENA